VWSRPQPLSTGLGPACCIAPLPPPQASGGGTSRSLTPRVPVRDWQLLVSRRFYESPRARHAPMASLSPSKPVAPSFYIRLRSRLRSRMIWIRTSSATHSA